MAGEAAYLISTRFLTASALSRSRFFANPAVFVSIGVLALVQAGFTYLPPMQRWFGVGGLDAGHWGLVAAAGLVVGCALDRVTLAAGAALGSRLLAPGPAVSRRCVGERPRR